MSSNHDYNRDNFTTGVENITRQGGWQINFQHIPTGHGVFFEAFITSFEDNFTSTWSEEDVFGRMDPIATYQNTKRNISFGFDVLAESEMQARKNTHRFQHLSSFLYPTYESSGIAKTLAAAPLIKIKFANLIQNAANAGQQSTTNPLHSGLVGYVDGFSYTPDLALGWIPETVSDTGGSRTTGIWHPVKYSVSVNFKVLHSHELGWTQDKKWMAAGKAFPHASGYGPGINDNVEGEAFQTPKKTDTVGEREKPATDQSRPGATGTNVDNAANANILGGT